MKKSVGHIVIGCAFALLILSNAGALYGQGDQPRERRAQTGMKFLSVSLDPRAAAMASAMTALDAGSMSLFYNPAGMSRIEGFSHVSLGQVSWIADVNYTFGSVSLRPAGGRFGVFGLSYVSVDYGEFIGTVRDATLKGYLDTGEFSPSAYAIGIGYARALTDRFAVGGHVRSVTQSLGESVMSWGGLVDEEVVSLDSLEYSSNDASVTAWDFGVMYRTGFHSLTFAMNVRNFAPEITYEEESFELPLSFDIGVAMDLIDFTSMDQNAHSLLLSVNTGHPRDFSEQLKIGVEYTFINTLSLRLGYITPTDEQGIALGVGVQRELGGLGFEFDYAYTEFGVFSAVNQFSLGISL